MSQYNLTCGCDCHTDQPCTGCAAQHQVDPAGRCARGPACVDARWHTIHVRHGDTIVDERREKLPAWATTRPTGLCKLCLIHTRTGIGALPLDFGELQILLPKTTSTVEASIGGTRDLPVPIRLSIATLADAIADELDRWAVVVAEQHSAKTGSWSWCYEQFDTLIKLGPIWVMRFEPGNPHMSGRDHLVVTEETGLDGALRLLQLHEHAEQVTGRTHRAERLWSPCPMCQRLSLEHPEGAPHVDCRRCGHRMTLDAYDQLANILTRAYAPSGTAA